jgi:hypothetical protein
MEEPMCWEIDYKLFAELEKARETKVKLDHLLHEANKQSDKINVEGMTVKEAEPAK